MKEAREELNLRQIGRGFIVDDTTEITGRRLTQTYVDQFDRTYVKVNGALQLLTEQHSYLAMD